MKTTTAEKLARELMDSHGLQDWTFKLDECPSEVWFMQRRDEDDTPVSRHHVAHHTTEQVRETILHEIAHALVPDHVAHGEEWKAMAKAVGAVPKACAGDDHSIIEGPWLVSCSSAVRSGVSARKTYIYRFKCCGRYMQWHNVETGEHWDGKPKKPKFVYVYRCSRCNRIVVQPKLFSVGAGTRSTRNRTARALLPVM